MIFFLIIFHFDINLVKLELYLAQLENEQALFNDILLNINRIKGFLS